ncbi:MAG: FtsX-like permease family protein, partial [Clostridia bacterium]|nr:FtsX-like permease family protein [Clostridia bacterium]
VRASFNHKSTTQVEDYKEQILAKDTQLKASEKKVKEAQKAQKKAEDELSEYIGSSKKDGIYDSLLKALQKYSDRDYTGSADALLDIDSKKLTTKNMKSIYNDLTAKVYPSAATGLYTKGERFDKKEVKQYKVTAILHENNPTSSFPILTKLSNSNAKYTVAAFQLKKLGRNSLNDVDDIANKLRVNDNKKVNTELLYSKFAFGKGSVVANLLPLVAIVLIIIMCASVVLIYNAFAMSLSEKVKYLGMLSSVGATKKQKRLSVYYEGFVLALFGIPLGMLAGVAGIGITLKALGKKIISTGMIMGVTEENVSMKVSFPIWAVITVLVLSIITIFISCTVPAKKASKISIISALRSADNIKVKSKSLKCPKYINKIFGYEGELAYKNLKRNGRKARVITVSIALSIVLFLSCNYFCSIFLNEITDETMPYQIGCTLEYNKKDEALKQISEVDKIDEMYCASSYFYSLDKTNNFRKNFSQFWESKYLTSAYKNSFDKNLYISVNFLDDDMFNELCNKNGIDSSKYYGNKNDCKVLLMNNVSHAKSG